MASVRRDADGWQDRVQFMRDAMHFSLGYRVTDQDAAEIAAYLNKLYGQDSDISEISRRIARVQRNRKAFLQRGHEHRVRRI